MGRGWIATLSGFAYGLFYLYAIGDLNFVGPPYWGGHIAELTVARIFSARATLMFEAIAVIEVGYLVWLISPLNLLIATLLSGLLAANVHGAIYLSAQKTCSTGRAGLVSSALPALLAGGACCAPSLILLLGVPALGALGAFFGWLVPVSVVALGLNRLWQHRRGAPPMTVG